MLVIKINAGAMADSNMPKSTRVATKPGKFETAHVTITATSQSVTMAPRYFPVGSFCMSHP